MTDSCHAQDAPSDEQQSDSTLPIDGLEKIAASIEKVAVAILTLAEVVFEAQTEKDDEEPDQQTL